MIIVKIICQLLFSSFIIFGSPPQFDLYNKLFAKVIHDYIRPPGIPCLCFDIIISCAVNDWFQIQQEDFPSVFFQKLTVVITVDIVII